MQISLMEGERRTCASGALKTWGCEMVNSWEEALNQLIEEKRALQEVLDSIKRLLDLTEARRVLDLEGRGEL